MTWCPRTCQKRRLLRPHRSPRRSGAMSRARAAAGASTSTATAGVNTRALRICSSPTQTNARWFAFSAARVHERVLAWLAEERIEGATEAGAGIRPLDDREQEQGR